MKDRSTFTKEELIQEVEFFQKQFRDMEIRLKTSYQDGYKRGSDASLEQFMDLVRPLYLACFTSKGWIGTANLGQGKTGSYVLSLLAHFHGKIK
jgi:hypothetical protein